MDKPTIKQVSPSKNGSFYSPAVAHFKIPKTVSSTTSSLDRIRDQRLATKLQDLQSARKKREKEIERLKLLNESSLKVKHDLVCQQRIKDSMVRFLMI